MLTKQQKRGGDHTVSEIRHWEDVLHELKKKQFPQVDKHETSLRINLGYSVQLNKDSISSCLRDLFVCMYVCVCMCVFVCDIAHFNTSYREEIHTPNPVCHSHIINPGL